MVLEQIVDVAAWASVFACLFQLAWQQGQDRGSLNSRSRDRGVVGLRCWWSAMERLPSDGKTCRGG